jgi:hypothetical protein
MKPTSFHGSETVSPPALTSYILTFFFLCAIRFVTDTALGQAVTFDDFNSSNGHFNSNPATGSGSSQNISNNSSAVQITTANPKEGAGHQRLMINPINAGGSLRLRHLSGAGVIGNNIAFTTGSGVDGWIGFYIRSDATNGSGWTVQIYMEDSVTNYGGTPKAIISDGNWHVYEWNLDDTSGGADGWGNVTGIANGQKVVNDGSHTIDSIVFRNTAAPASNTLFLDYLAKSASGSVSNLLSNPCLNTSSVQTIGPVSTNSNQVTVAGVAANATAVTVYQNSGTAGAFVAIGTKTTGIAAGNNVVTVTGLQKGALVGATQTIGGQEGCAPTTGITVGGGANPSVKIALSIRETSTSGPVGTAGNTSSGNIHFLGATSMTSGAPTGGPVFYPSNQWQTVTFTRGPVETLGNSANVLGSTVDGAGYATNDDVAIQVYGFTNLPNGTTIFSPAGTQSGHLTSNATFNIEWAWDSVIGAQGYRVLRNKNSSGYVSYQDTVLKSLSDTNTGWLSGSTVTPTSCQSGKSIKWNTGSGDPIGTTNSIPTAWGILEAIGFSIDGISDTGPFDIYIDNIKNGATVFQDFEGAVSGTTDVGFRDPFFSGTTSGNLLTSPDVGQVSSGAAFAGTKSFHARWQWSGTNTTKWLRLTTSGVGDPQVYLDDPISFRLLMVPVNGSVTPPPGPTLSISTSGGKPYLTWPGAHNLQAAPSISGTVNFTNVPGITTSPYTDPNPLPSGMKFYRLAN